LHICAEKGTIEMLDVLLDKGADANYEYNGKTALKLAINLKHYDFVKKLKLFTTKEPIEETNEPLNESVKEGM